MSGRNSGVDYGSIQHHHDLSEDEERIGMALVPPPSSAAAARHPPRTTRMAGSFAFLMFVAFVIASLRSTSDSDVSMTDHLLAAIRGDDAPRMVSGSKTHAKKNKKQQHSKDEEKRDYSSTPRFYTDQLVDHLDDSNSDANTWSQRYYAKKEHWQGPGHPIFLMIGGEGANDVGFFYPFIDDVLAKKFGAYSLHPEHRFYGQSQPVLETAMGEDLAELLTPEQAMLDMLQLVNHYRKKLGCSTKKTSKKYCPVITVGGSYPGFLSAMMRYLYPESIDIGYASSAPLKLYSHEVDQWGYYDIVTQAADRASPGCATAVRQALAQADEIIRGTPDFETLATEQLGICPGSIPRYIGDSALFSQELMQTIETTFADANMIGNYPPSNHTWTAELCHVFQNSDLDSLEKVKDFWNHLEIQDESVDCFQMDYQLSAGPRATISSADWSGLGPGLDGKHWEFQCCYSLIPEVGFSEASMFPPREWTYDWLTEHCLDRFGVVGEPMAMVNQWKFNDLVGQGASRILFTNGGNDMWNYGGYTQNLSDSIVAINFPNGAHHSEVYARPDDTADIREGQAQIADILSDWLKEIAKEKK